MIVRAQAEPNHEASVSAELLVGAEREHSAAFDLGPLMQWASSSSRAGLLGAGRMVLSSMQTLPKVHWSVILVGKGNQRDGG